MRHVHKLAVAGLSALAGIAASTPATAGITSGGLWNGNQTFFAKRLIDTGTNAGSFAGGAIRTGESTRNDGSPLDDFSTSPRNEKFELPLTPVGANYNDGTTATPTEATHFTTGGFEIDALLSLGNQGTNTVTGAEFKNAFGGTNVFTGANFVVRGRISGSIEEGEQLAIDMDLLSDTTGGSLGVTIVSLAFFGDSAPTVSEWLLSPSSGGPSPVPLDGSFGFQAVGNPAATTRDLGAAIGKNNGTRFELGVSLFWENFADDDTIRLGFDGTIQTIEVVPAPGAAALLGVAGVAAGRRRRSSSR